MRVRPHVWRILISDGHAARKLTAPKLTKYNLNAHHSNHQKHLWAKQSKTSASALYIFDNVSHASVVAPVYDVRFTPHKQTLSTPSRSPLWARAGQFKTASSANAAKRGELLLELV